MDCEYRDDSVKPCRHYIKPRFCSLGHQFLCLEAMKRMAPRISHSELQTYGKCYRAWWLSYAQGIEPIKTPVRMLAGRIFGECLDELLRKEG
jgi:hypothetical protein